MLIQRATHLLALLALVALVLVLGVGGCGDDASGADAGSPDGGADAQIDGGNLTPAHCRELGPLPGWAAFDVADGRLLARCQGHDLHAAALEDGMMRLSYVVTDGAVPGRSWAITAMPPPPAKVYAGGLGGDAVLCTEHLAIRVSADTCRVVVWDAADTVLLDDGDDGGWLTGTGLVDGVPKPTVSVVRQTPTTERFYGLGERNGPLDRRGTVNVFWNTDAYDGAHGGFAPDADPLYQSIPLLIGLRQGVAYGVFTDNPHRLEIDVARAAPDRYQVTAFGGAIDQYVIAGASLAEVVRRYTRLTGRMALPPRWALGYHQCRWGYSPDTRLNELATEFRSRQLPADALWLDIQHMDGFRTFSWDPVAFADPAALAASLAVDGFKLTVIADPGIKVDPGWSVYDTGVARDVFLREPGGDLYVGSVWPGDSVFPDFTNPEARAWWGEHLASLTALGVRGIWLDVNEPTNFPESGGGNSIPNDVPVHGDGVSTTLAEAHNVYALNEARATYDGLVQAAPDRRPFILTRAAYAGIQRYAAAWTGDAPSTWTSLAQSLPMLLNMSLSGEPFVGSDVGGYSGGASPELFARWMGLGAISPFFRGHVTNGVNDQEPWAFGQEVEDISRSHLGWRYRLLPYLYSLFDEARATGAPVLRPLVYAFQDDDSAASIQDQALLGPWLLAAPVVTEGATERSIYLPAGRWYEYRSGAIYDGPTTVDLEVTLAALPRYVREGAILPHGPLMQHTGERPVDPLTLELYPADPVTRFLLYEDSGDGFAHRDADCYSRMEYLLQRTATGASLVIGPRQGACPPPPRTLELRLRRVDQAPASVTLDGVDVPAFAEPESIPTAGPGWAWDDNDLSVVVRLPDTDDATLTFTYDPTIGDPRPWVLVPIEVQVPAGTPTDPPIHIVSSVESWVHQPLTWTDPQTAIGTLAVPRGEWYFFKYTRGDWTTVEKWPACVEADNRYGFGAARASRQDTVWTWADWCP